MQDLVRYAAEAAAEELRREMVDEALAAGSPTEAAAPRADDAPAAGGAPAEEAEAQMVGRGWVEAVGAEAAEVRGGGHWGAAGRRRPRRPKAAEAEAQGAGGGAGEAEVGEAAACRNESERQVARLQTCMEVGLQACGDLVVCDHE